MMNIDLTKYDLVPVSSSNVSIEKCNDKFEDEYVYDIEVADNSHTFFANDILLHNSIYIRMDSVLLKLFGTTDIDWNSDETIQKIKDYVDHEFQDDINKHCADFLCDTFFTDQRRVEFKREKISAQGDFLAKKHYVCHVVDNEGFRCDKFTYTGVDVKKNELPDSIKNLLKAAIEGFMIEDWSNNKFQVKIREIYNQFCELPIEKMSYIKNYSTKKSAEYFDLEKGANAHAKAAEYYNQVLRETGLSSKYEFINMGDRFHYFYCHTDNPYGIAEIGYKDKWPKEFNKLFKPDINLMFQKTCMAPLRGFMENHAFAKFEPELEMDSGAIPLFDL